MSRIISVSNEVYDALSKRKNGKSFSETIKSLYDKPCKSPLDVIASWAPSEDFIKGAEKAYSDRKKFKLKKVVF